MKNKKIAIDVDEVLANTLPAMIDFHNETYDTNLKTEDFKYDRLYKVWGGDEEEELLKVRNFYKSKHFREIVPVHNSEYAIKELTKDFDLFVVTARGDDIADITKEWIYSYYPNCFDDIYFANHYASPNEYVPKSKLCSNFGASFLVDDSFEYATDCVSGDREVLLFDYPWNRGFTLVEGITRVYSWEEILGFFRKKLSS